VNELKLVHSIPPQLEDLASAVAHAESRELRLRGRRAPRLSKLEEHAAAMLGEALLVALDTTLPTMSPALYYRLARWLSVVLEGIDPPSAEADLGLPSR
jgi:hypothetical protein